MRCIGNLEREKTVDREASGFGRDQRGGAAVGEDEEREDLFELVEFLKMEGAEFEIQHQDCGIGLGADDVMRSFERVDGGVTAHEIDHGSLDGRVEIEMADDFEVESGCVLTGAGGNDNMSDAAAFFFGQSEFVQGDLRQLRGEALVELHALRSGGEVAFNVNIFDIFP